MNRTLRALPLFILLLALPAAIPALAAPKAPDWVKQVAAQAVTVPCAEAGAVVLLDETVTAYQNDGGKITSVRYVLRILNSTGIAHAKAHIHYNKKGDRITAYQGWLIAPDGQVTRLERSDAYDIALHGHHEIMGEHSVLELDPARKAGNILPGSVFAYEANVKGTDIFGQDSVSFQIAHLPVECARITYNLPQGWTLQASLENHPATEPRVSGQSTTWELKGIPYPTDEAYKPAHTNFSPWLKVNVTPAPGAASKLISFSSWKQMSAYITPHYEKAAAPDDAIKAKAAELTATASDAWSRIRALCRYVQKTNYVSINLNLAKGGGYIPRPAAKVLQTHYGDCKDKATLLCSLLKTVGIESFPVFLYSGDARHVRPDWSAPQQFYHAILAIRVDDTVNTPAVIRHPALGRLLIFDPTNPYLAPGLLPQEDQSGLALLAAGDSGELLRLPTMPAADNRTEISVQARLLPNGTLTGDIRLQSLGLASVDDRAMQTLLQPTEYKERIITWLTERLAAVKLEKIQPTDDFDAASNTLYLTLSANGHGKLMRDTMLVFKPSFLAGRQAARFKNKTRISPIEISGANIAERTEIELPAGFAVEELPSPVDISGPYGSFKLLVKAGDDNKLLVERTLVLNDTLVPASEYVPVKTFFDKIHAAQQSPAVLRRI